MTTLFECVLLPTGRRPMIYDWNVVIGVTWKNTAP
jgi:hypothetical protein